MHVEAVSLVPYGPITNEEAIVQKSENRLPRAGGDHHGLHGSGDKEDGVVIRR